MECLQAVFLHVPGFQFIEYIFNFNTIGANILHGGGPHLSGNQAQVFNAGIPLCNTIQYKMVPVFPGGSFYIKKFCIFFYQFNAFQFIFYQKTIKIFGE